MATFTADLPFDYRKLDLYKNFENAEFVPDANDPSHVFYVYPDSSTAITIGGHDFMYLPNGAPYAGTTTSAALFVKNPVTNEYLPGYTLSNVNITTAQATKYLHQDAKVVAADVLKGTDFIIGSKYNDHINGYTGVDFLTGGAGNDTFYFTTPIATNNIDHITKFEHTHDKIALSKSLFKIDPGQKLSEAFHDVTAGGVRVEKDTDHILYNHKTGYLYYDADGKGGHSPVHFATIDSHSLLTGSDFLFV